MILANQQLLWYVGLFALIVAMVGGVIWVHRIWSDIKTDAAESLTEPDDLLGPLSQAYLAGQMSEEEYRRIKDSVGRELGADPDVLLRSAIPTRRKVSPQGPIAEAPDGGERESG